MIVSHVEIAYCGVRESVSGVNVLDKAVLILDALERTPLTLTELSAATGLPRATAHRLSVALERHGLVARDDVGRFELGPRLVSLAGAGATGGRSLAEVARPALTILRDTTGESSQLYVPWGDSSESKQIRLSPLGT